MLPPTSPPTKLLGAPLVTTGPRITQPMTQRDSSQENQVP